MGNALYERKSAILLEEAPLPTLLAGGDLLDDLAGVALPCAIASNAPGSFVRQVLGPVLWIYGKLMLVLKSWDDGDG